MTFIYWTESLQGGLGNPIGLVVEILFIGIFIGFFILFLEKLLEWWAVKLLKH
jgi:hypothetical protein